VGDAVSANLMAVESEKTGTYNVRTGIGTSDQRTFHLVGQACGYHGQPQYQPVRPGEVQRISLETSLIKKTWNGDLDLS
jgi:UDP-glucose 4-epimerase